MIHLLCAEDDLLADELVRQMRGRLPDGAETLGLTAEASDVPGLDEALHAPSLFATDRMVVIDGAERLQAAGVKRLTEAIDAGEPVGELVVVAVSERPPAGLLKALQGRAKIHRLPKPKRGELVAWTAKRLKAAGLKPDHDVPGFLVETVGQNLRDLAQAVTQLATRGGGPVTRAEVDARFRRTADQPVWALFDAMAAADGHRAFRVLHTLFEHGHDPIAVLFALVSQVRYVMRARSAIERAPHTDQQLAQALAVSPGRAAVLRRQAGQLSWEWLLRLHRLCADADFELKGGDEVRITGVLPPEIVLERVVDGALPATEAPWAGGPT